MAVLVTGGAGFIGSNAVAALRRSGHEVVVVDDLSNSDGTALPADVRLFEGDFADPDLLGSIVEHGRIGSCIHFAARKDAAESVGDPLRYYRENLAKSVRLLSFLAEHGIERFVFSSTAAVYGEPVAIPIDEAHPTRPANPYGASKLLFEQVLADVASRTPLRFVSLRYFNAAGAGEGGILGNAASDRHDLVSVLMQAAMSGEPVTINGTDYPTEDGTAVRDLIHVSDLADAHVRALDHLARGETSATLNLGSERGFSVRQVIEAARRITGAGLPTVEGPRRPGDVAVSVASARRARDLLGWQPSQSDLDTIVRTAWEWECRRNEGSR